MATATASAADTAAVTAQPHLTERAQLARRAAFSALLLGCLADGLLRAMPLGLNLVLWAGAAAAALVALAWRRDERLHAESALWLAVAVVLVSAFAWRDAGMLLFFDFVGALGAIAFVAMTLRGGPALSVFEARLRDLAYAGMLQVAHAVGRAPFLVLRDAEPGVLHHGATRGRATAVTRAAVLAGLLLLLFAPLLTQADPVFGSLFTLPKLDFGNIVGHVLMTGFFAWVTAGWLRGALIDQPSAVPGDGVRLVTFGALDVTAALGALDLLFGAFVVVQLGWLFGGEALVQRTTGLSYAEYARRGFFELTWVALLTMPTLLAVRSAIAPDDARAMRRYRVLATVCVALIGAIILSAAARMRLYVRYYGLSEDRLYASVIMLWIALSLAALAGTVLRERPRRFASAVVGAGLAVLVGLNFANPTRLVVESQLARASARNTAPELEYLATLGAEEAPRVLSLVLAQRIVPDAAKPAELKASRDRCAAIASLLRSYGSNRDRGEGGDASSTWRSWNAARSRAFHVVARHEAELRDAMCFDPQTKQVERFGGRERSWGRF